MATCHLVTCHLVTCHLVTCHLPSGQVRAQMSEMVAVTAAYHLSWNSVLVASPQTIMLDPRYQHLLTLKPVLFRFN